MDFIKVIKTFDFDQIEIYLASNKEFDKDFRDEFGKSALHYAVENEKIDIVKFLIDYQCKVDIFDLDNQTPLHYATEKGLLEMTNLLLSKGANANFQSNQGETPLHYAILSKNTEIISLLLNNKYSKANIDATDENGSTPLHKAAFRCYEDKMFESVILYLVSRGASLMNTDISHCSPIDFFVKEGKAEEYLFKGIQKEFSFIQILPRLKSPVKTLNKLLDPDFVYTDGDNSSLFVSRNQTAERYSLMDDGAQEKKSILHELFYMQLSSQNPFLLYNLIMLYENIIIASQNQVIEKNDLFSVAEKVENMITEIFQTNSMDIPINVQKLLQPHLAKRLSTEARYEISQNKLLLIQAKSLQRGNIIEYCIKNRIKILFQYSQVTGFIDDIFLSPLRLPALKIDENIDKIMQIVGWPLSSIPIFDPDERFKELLLLSLSLRSCPAFMFAFQFFSKLSFLYLVALISIDIYAKTYKADFSYIKPPLTCTSDEYSLMLTLLGQIMYEIGILIEKKWNFTFYFNDGWNKIDWIILSSSLLWFFLRISCADINITRVLLALIAIPQSIGLLRFLAVGKPLGELIILIKVMIADIFVFATVYLVSILGFGITFYAIFYAVPGEFSNSFNTFLTLFQYSFSNFDFTIFTTSSATINTVGIIVLMIYLIFTAIVMLNLLIARMTNAQERVDANAIREWAFAKARTVSQYLLLEEKHVLCMLPPPLNLLMYPLHNWYLAKSVSIGGTISNVLFSYFGAVVRIYAVISYISTMALGALDAVRRRDYRALNWEKGYYFKLFSGVILGFIVFITFLIYSTFLAPIVVSPYLIEKVLPDGTLIYLKESQFSTKLSRSGSSKKLSSASLKFEMELNPMNKEKLENNDDSSNAKNLLLPSESSNLPSVDPNIPIEEEVLFNKDDIERICFPLRPTSRAIQLDDYKLMQFQLTKQKQEIDNLNSKMDILIQLMSSNKN